MSSAETPEINEEAVPCCFLYVSVFESFEGQEGSTPGERSDKIFVTAENIVGCAEVLLLEEGGEYAGSVVVWRSTFKD